MNEWAEVAKANEELDRLLANERGNFIVPVSAFVTFESEEGIQRCL